MRHGSWKTFAWLAGIIIAGMILDAAVLKGRLGDWTLAAAGRPAGYLFGRFSSGKLLWQHVREWRTLASENERLRRERDEFTAASARLQELERENGFLREAAEIKPAGISRRVEAGVFRVSADLSGYRALVNRGSRDGVAQGDVVVTPEGILAGKIIEVWESYARLQMVNDPGFEVTARVLNSQTTGIARGDRSQGMSLDLVTQEDQIAQGDQVVSAGTDILPAALVIGTVAHVEASETKLFKSVRIDPAVDRVSLERVLILGS